MLKQSLLYVYCTQSSRDMESNGNSMVSLQRLPASDQVMRALTWMWVVKKVHGSSEKMTAPDWQLQGCRN